VSSRLPALRPSDLEPSQRRLYESMVANEVPLFEQAGVEVRAPDGALLGPFNPLLFSPVLGAAQLEAFRADKADSALSRRVHEIVILTVGAALDSDYELYAHRTVGRLAGLTADEIEALTGGRAPDLPNQEEASAYEFTRQLVEEHRVDPQAYEAAERALGPRALVDMVLLLGLYMTTCSIINAFEVPAPVGPLERREALTSE
jgi:4-carboxymuconolactone decarboxylase